jgi:Fe2+ or Zn2+ uptake regulation protein
MSRETSVDNNALLRRRGLKVTAQRLAVLRAVSDRPHRTADDIYTVVRAEIGATSRQAVYDALAALTDTGLFRRIQPAGSSARYENRVGDNHHHLICRTCDPDGRRRLCGRRKPVSDVDGPRVSGQLRRPAPESTK